jgi:hypothetical protein
VTQIVSFMNLPFLSPAIWMCLGSFLGRKCQFQTSFSKFAHFVYHCSTKRKHEYRSYVLFFTVTITIFFGLMNHTITGFTPFDSFAENPSSIVGQPVPPKLSKTNPKLNLFKLTHLFLSAIGFI